MPSERPAAIAVLVLSLAMLATSQGDDDAWSFRPIERQAIPKLNKQGWARSPIDAFILEKLALAGLAPSEQAERHHLMRRAFFDLTGLPPTPEDIAEFLADTSLDPFSRLTDRLLASPRHGERWARHWMDVVHFAETHGHDEDAIRENAWPYRDYLVRAFNTDLPYARFVEEQVAGDVLFPDDPWATVATSFLACGPWDESSQMGIQDGTIDKEIARYLDRDDMITTTMSTFTSTTVHCARCHDHKFDPVPIEDYYGLQAVFAGVDRVDRPYDPDPKAKPLRRRLLAEKSKLDRGELPLIDASLQKALQDWIDHQLADDDAWKVLIPHTIRSTGKATMTPLNDGSILVSGETPKKDTYHITGIPGEGILTAIQLEVLTHESLPNNGPGLAENGNLHLCNIEVHVGDQRVSLRSAAADFNQGGWTIDHAIDQNPDSAWGIHPQTGKSHTAIFLLETPVHLTEEQEVTVILDQTHGRDHVIGRPRLSTSFDPAPALSTPLEPSLKALCQKPARARTSDDLRTLTVHYLRERNAEALANLPPQAFIYAISSNFEAQGNFKPALKPRAVSVLKRGNIHKPGPPAQPGALSKLAIPDSPFPLKETGDNEGLRREGLARWLSNPDNPLTWRSITNRVWHYHFGRGIVATPNDFGQMGARPTHPELLDWLAQELRLHDGSLKWLHRNLMTSAVYQQRSNDHAENINQDPLNQWLWRMTPRRLQAEEIRDAALQIADKLDLTMGGPSARQFHTSKGVHVTPVVDYLSFDPDNPANLRRSVYRFVFRTVPDPLMQALDCPDASQLTPARAESVTPLQALAMLNNQFLIRQTEHWADRLADLDSPVNQLFLLAYGRPPATEELEKVNAFIETHRLANACRVLLNSNEFMFIR